MENSYDVLIIHHHTTNTDRPILVQAIGLIGMADHLQQNGYSVQVVNLGVEQNLDPGFDVAAYVESTGASVVGLSAQWFFQLPDSLEIARQIKARVPGVTLVMGGYSASYFAEEIMRDYPSIDVVVRGDGEGPLLDLCRVRLRQRSEDWSAIPNLVYRTPAGAVHATPFTYSLSAGRFADLRFTNMSLMRNHEAYLRLVYYPTKLFRDRFDFEGSGILLIAPTRGCDFSCSLCGGHAGAQKLIFNREGCLYQPIDRVMDDIMTAMGYGYRNFYMCSDPDPNGPYYFELFERIRRERLPIRFMFESWGLPSRRFIDAFRSAFDDGLFIISPDSADEEVRRRHKGPLSYGNEELLDRLGHIADRGLVAQVFFGYFLPGDTVESVIRTRRFAHDLESESCEVFYLAFSTDPASPVFLAPETYGMVLEIRTLADYLEALPRPRLSPNLLAHRPTTLAAEDAARLEKILSLDGLVHKILSTSLRYLRALTPTPEAYHGLLEALYDDLAGEVKPGEMVATSRLIEAARDRMTQAAPAGDGRWAAAAELLDYEAAPYLLMERHFDRVGLHYSANCHELALDREGREAFLGRETTIVERRRYRWDVRRLHREVAGGRVPIPEEVASTLVFALDRTGAFCSFDDTGER
jgi:radical SAM superfamily enzyme YgiQ (UPF0313 family)